MSISAIDEIEEVQNDNAYGRNMKWKLLLTVSEKLFSNWIASKIKNDNENPAFEKKNVYFSILLVNKMTIYLM